MRKTAVLLAACMVALSATGTARADGGVYVALGDSYTSGPLIPNQYGEPIDCARSARQSYGSGLFRQPKRLGRDFRLALQ